jgi:hypothetical protein
MASDTVNSIKREFMLVNRLNINYDRGSFNCYNILNIINLVELNNEAPEGECFRRFDEWGYPTFPITPDYQAPE